jgi:multiple sugar transport system ATP-binding protein
MNNGVLQQVGTPVEIYRAPVNQFVARFIGSPTMNMLSGSLLEENGSLYLLADSIKIKLPASTAASLKAKNLKQVTLGVRPERLYVKPQNEQNLELPISVIENIGPEFLVYSFHKQGQTVIRTPDEPTGDSLSLGLDPEHLHLFDEQGYRIAE